jgi:hypothetical protein
MRLHRQQAYKETVQQKIPRFFEVATFYKKYKHMQGFDELVAFLQLRLCNMHLTKMQY